VQEPAARMWTVLVDRRGHRETLTFPTLHDEDEIDSLTVYVESVLNASFVRIKNVEPLFYEPEEIFKETPKDIFSDEKCKDVVGKHFILKCKHCDVVLAQCRCMSADKEVTLGVCAACKEKEK